MSALCVRQKSANPISIEGARYGFPKDRRLLRRSDFRKVYDEGSRWSCAYFAAFALAVPEPSEGHHGQGPKVGFTVSRAMGRAVVRNRMKRRMREAVRLHVAELPSRWWVVFNPRKPVLEVDFPTLEAEVVRFFARCANS